MLTANDALITMPDPLTSLNLYNMNFKVLYIFNIDKNGIKQDIRLRVRLVARTTPQHFL